MGDHGTSRGRHAGVTGPSLPAVDQQRAHLASLGVASDRLRCALLGACLTERVLAACDDLEAAVRAIRAAHDRRDG